MVTLQPMALYYSQEEEDPLSEDNKAAAKNMKKVAAIFFSVLGLILTAIAIINDWAAYFQTIFSLVE